MLVQIVHQHARSGGCEPAERCAQFLQAAVHGGSTARRIYVPAVQCQSGSDSPIGLRCGEGYRGMFPVPRKEKEMRQDNADLQPMLKVPLPGVKLATCLDD
ncbi:hypothetical protein N7499_000737 [Penicillium canescens]|nr:hypothetical protein N7522_005429 [Penicillium canescens]KAJ6101107.1 hypothetical protein N7499_000737 [Penicillium canescens]KAJ6173565.1 hypothetical protein N7485_006377 [Penicillium canescens]